MRKAIHQVAADILAEYQRPMTADEILNIALSKGLYEFKAKSPKSVLRSQLRRHCSNISGPNQASSPLFHAHEDGRFSLI
jgi:glycerol-3-phosphate dehydrogenase